MHQRATASGGQDKKYCGNYNYASMQAVQTQRILTVRAFVAFVESKPDAQEDIRYIGCHRGVIKVQHCGSQRTQV